MNARAPTGGGLSGMLLIRGVYNSFSGLKLRIEAFFGSECSGGLILSCKISMGIFFQGFDKQVAHLRVFNQFHEKQFYHFRQLDFVSSSSSSSSSSIYYSSCFTFIIFIIFYAAREKCVDSNVLSSKELQFVLAEI